MIEYLALAAEVTAVLLIISIAYPSKNKQRSIPRSPIHNEKTAEALTNINESSLESLLILAYQSSAVQIEKYSSLGDWLQTDAHRDISEAISGITKHLENRELDSLCRLPSIKSFEQQLSQTHVLRTHLDLTLYAAVISVDKWGEIVEQYGQVAGERLLRELAGALSGMLSLHGTVIRYSDFAFGTGLFGLNLSQATKVLSAIRGSFESRKIAIGENEVNVSFSMALTRVQDSDFDSDNHLQGSLWERLDDGITESITAGGDQLHVFNTDSNSWTNLSIDFITDSLLLNASIERTSISTPNIEVRSALVETPPEIDSSVPANTSSSQELPLKDLTSETNTTQEPTSGSAPAQESNAAVSVASSDDIAALFAAQKAKPKAAQAKTPTVSSTDNPIPGPTSDSKSVSSPDAEDAVPTTELDVAVPSAVAVPASVIAPLPDRTPVPASAPSLAPAAGQDATGAKATSDDIAALFASMKSGPGKKPPANDKSAKPVTAVQNVEESKTTATEVNADKSAAKMETPPPQEESLIASIEDISALFAAAQKNYKGKGEATKSPSAAQNKLVENAANSADNKASPLNEPTTTSSTNQAVSADDIESLFASMRK